MEFLVGRDELLKVVGVVSAVVERRQAKPILGHVLVKVAAGVLVVTGTDQEVEMVMSCPAEGRIEGATTVPGRKLLEIVRALPAGASVRCQIEGGRFRLSVGRSRFHLATLPAEEFPNVTTAVWDNEFRVAGGELRKIIEKTQFCMAQQDVRYYLNGLMLETLGGSLKAVAADGHRLALCGTSLGDQVVGDRQIIVPRKAVVEMMRFLGHDISPVDVSVSANHIRIKQDQLVFVSKLVDGRFPDYQRVIPGVVKGGVTLPREGLREMLGRVGVVSTEKFRGIRLWFKDRSLAASATNSEHDEAWEELELDEDVAEFEIGFNVSYLMEVLGALEGQKVVAAWADEKGGWRIKDVDGTREQVYVVMPVRL